MEILRKYVMGYNPISVQVISDQAVHFGMQKFNRVNWEGKLAGLLLVGEMALQPVASRDETLTRMSYATVCVLPFL